MLIKVAQADDFDAVAEVLARSYPALLAADYPAEVMAQVVPLIARPRPELLASGRYFLAVLDGQIVGAGGYSLNAPAGRDAPVGAATPGLAHIRHVASDPAHLRRGIGRAVMAAIFAAAQSEGSTRFECLSTLTAVPFYAALGFEETERVTLPIGPLGFAAVRMLRSD